MRDKKIGIVVLLLSALVYGYLHYFTPREDYTTLWVGVLFVFVAYLLMLRFQQQHFSILILGGVLIRILLLFGIPNLSDDYFRFVWDGELLVRGVHSFDYLPSEWLKEHPSAFMQYLYEGMNSSNYYSIYPPFCQVLFWLSANLFSGDIWEEVVFMKVVFFAVEMLGLVGLIKWLNVLNIQKERLFIYWLNPLIIMELTTNLHFELIMIVGLIWTFYALHQQSYFIAAFTFFLAVGVKLIPLMLLPLLMRRLPIKQLALFYGLVGLLVISSFGLFYDGQQLVNMFTSVRLYFQTFEFNASFYYLVRWVGFQVKGYNIIQTAGPILSVIPVTGIFLLALFKVKRKESWSSFYMAVMWVFLLYFGVASIVHPWYIAIFILLAVVTGYEFPIWWSLLAFLSYYTYKDTKYTENLWLTTLEYSLLYGMMCYELMKEKGPILFRRISRI